MSAIFLRQTLDKDATLKGEIKGVAYSGSVIPFHGMYDNLVIDVATLSVAKEKTPILRDHNPSHVAGHGKVTIEGSVVNIEGSLSKKTAFGAEIISLAEDGLDWEMSLGVYNGEIEEIENTEVNGIMIEKGWALRNGLLREVSVVALGADMNTEAQIFKQLTGDEKPMFTKEQWINFACGCGGTKDTTPEELSEMVKATKLMSEEEKAKAEELAKEIEVLKEQIAAKQAEIDAIKEEEEIEEREEEINAAISAKGIEFSVEKIKESAKSKEVAALLLGLVEAMPKQAKKISAEFAQEVVVAELAPKVDAKSPEQISLAANALVKAGKAKDFMEALTILEVK